MAEYLTESAYRRWYRQYQLTLKSYIDLLDRLRLKIDAIPLEQSEKIKELIDEIEQKLDEAAPRNFDFREPIAGLEKFYENSKVLINLIRRFLHKPDQFEGIYKEEKDRVQKIHSEFQFKEKLKIVQDMVGVEKPVEETLEKVSN